MREKANIVLKLTLPFKMLWLRVRFLFKIKWRTCRGKSIVKRINIWDKFVHARQPWSSALVVCEGAAIYFGIKIRSACTIFTAILMNICVLNSPAELGTFPKSMPFKLRLDGWFSLKVWQQVAQSIWTTQALQYLGTFAFSNQHK